MLFVPRYSVDLTIHQDFGLRLKLWLNFDRFLCQVVVEQTIAIALSSTCPPISELLREGFPSLKPYFHENTPQESTERIYPD